MRSIHPRFHSNADDVSEIQVKACNFYTSYSKSLQIYLIIVLLWWIPEATFWGTDLCLSLSQFITPQFLFPTKIFRINPCLDYYYFSLEIKLAKAEMDIQFFISIRNV